MKRSIAFLTPLLVLLVLLTMLLGLTAPRRRRRRCWISTEPSSGHISSGALRTTRQRFRRWSGRGCTSPVRRWARCPEGSSIGERDGFLVKFLPNGTEVWTRQFGTTDNDAVYGMASDPKGVVSVGTTHGAFEGQTNAGDRDVFLVRIAFS